MMVKRVFFLIQCALLLGLMFWFPWFQERLPAIQMPHLSGAYSLEEKPVVTVNNWLDGSFQKSWQTYIQEDRTARPLFVRIKNQFHYRLFGKSPNTTIVLGKDHYLFGKQELAAYIGLDFMGETAIQRKTEMLLSIQAYLVERGKKLLVVLPPGKPRFIPQKLPDHLQLSWDKPTNRQRFISAFNSQGIPYLAFEHFTSEKEDEPYLYPPGGLHWSHMGATHAMDTLIMQVENMLGIQMKKLKIDSVEFTHTLRAPDNDLQSVLNMIRPTPGYLMPYPRVRFESDSSTTLPKLLIIGDSFYRTLFDLGYHDATFSSQSVYWHYFTQQISKQNPGGIPLNKDQINILQAVKEADLLLIVAGESNLHQLGFGFIETLHALID